MNTSASMNGPRIALLFASLACWAVSTGPAHAQQAQVAPTFKPVERTEVLLPGRNRSRMHPGNPLVIVGLEEGDNDIRSRTPALAQSDRAVAYVNPEENYQRTLAMYEKGASFHEPLLARTQVPSTFSNPNSSASFSPAAQDSASRPQNEFVPAGSQSSGDVIGRKWPWVLGLGMSAVLCYALLKRFGVQLFKLGTS